MATDDQPFMATKDRRVLLLLLRHAQSENNHLEADDGVNAAARNGLNAAARRQADPMLSALGVAQSAECGRWIAEQWGTRISHIHVSPMTRTLLTAAPLVRALPDVPASLHTDAFECGGCFNGPHKDEGHGHAKAWGRNVSEIRELIPSISLADVGERGWWRGGFEPESESRARAARVCEWAWQQVPADAPADDAEPAVVVLVTHGLFMNVLLQAFFGMAGGDGTISASFLSANAAIWMVELRISPSPEPKARAGLAPTRSLAVLAAGRTDHIPPHLRSGHSLRGFKIPACME
jgi:broad specificity phosphatase PhoE